MLQSSGDQRVTRNSFWCHSCIGIAIYGDFKHILIDLFKDGPVSKYHPSKPYKVLVSS